MKAWKENKLIRLILIAGFVLILDQVTKAVILQTMPLYDSITIVPGFFNIVHVQNPGGAFGLFGEAAPFIRQLVFLFFAPAVVGFTLYMYYKTPLKPYPLFSLSLAIINGGAIGNIIDRIRFGKVIDFLDVYIGSSHWPAFNVADSALCIGIAVFGYHVLFDKTPEEAEDSKKSEKKDRKKKPQ